MRKENINKISILILFILLVINPTIVLAINDNYFYSEHKIYVEKYGKKYLDILKKNQYSLAKASKIIESFTVNKNGEPVYPEYIGGMYIDDSDNLVIQIVNENYDSLEEKKWGSL